MNGSNLPALPCLCSTLRRTSRALTQLYEDALRPIGLRATQFTVLLVLQRVGEVPQGELGRILAMDSTTLTRTLQILSRHRWISERRGRDRRERWLRLAAAGEAKLQDALPVWNKLQNKLRRRVGANVWDEVMRTTNQLTELVNAQPTVKGALQ
jgi:DNA-binding MarR family transcriptional regulator